MQDNKNKLNASVDVLINALIQSHINYATWQKGYYTLINLMLSNANVDYMRLALSLISCKVDIYNEVDEKEFNRKKSHLSNFVIILDEVLLNSPETLVDGSKYRLLFADAINAAIESRHNR